MQAGDAGGGCGHCPRYHAAVELIGRRWNGVIVRAMLNGCGRYSEIRGAVPELSDTLLSQRLKELEASGIIERSALTGEAARARYDLTEMGAALGPVVEQIEAWAQRWEVTRTT